MKTGLMLIIFLLVFLTGGIQAQDQVFISVFPLRDLVEIVAGEGLEVKQVVPTGADAHGYEPSPRRIAELEQADIFFYIGLGLEPWAEKAVENLEHIGIPVVELSSAARLRKIDDQHEHENQEQGHNSESQAEDDHHHHHHNHSGYDPHVWLDPENMIRMARLVKEELTALYPDQEEVFSQNFDSYQERVRELDKEFKRVLENRHSDYILTSHAAFGYLADRYGLKQLSVAGISPHAEPSPHALIRLLGEVEKHDLQFIFLETLASPATAEVLAREADLEILILNPLEGLTREEQQRGEDYFSLMRENLDNLKKALVNGSE